jgi:hypothetical protein
MKPVAQLILAVLTLITITQSKVFAQGKTLEFNQYSTVPDKTYKNLFTFAPLGIANKLRFRYERVVANNYSLGLQVSSYYGLYPGYQALLVGKYYKAKAAPLGRYFMQQIGVGQHTLKDSDKKSSGVIIGIAVGNQSALDKEKRFILDFYIGLKATIMNDDAFSYDVSNWYSTGPGSIFNCGLNLGFRF